MPTTHNDQQLLTDLMRLLDECRRQKNGVDTTKKFQAMTKRFLAGMVDRRITDAEVQYVANFGPHPWGES